MRTPTSGPLGLGLLGLAFLAAGCAYFNTFYLAKKYYREGRKAQERSLGDQIAPEAAQKYDMAARQCQKVLTDYGKTKWADDAAFLLGASLYGKGDYATAIRKLEDFRKQYAQSPFIAEARLIQGMAYLKRRDYAEADSTFLDLNRNYPKLDRKWDLFFSGGESRAFQRDPSGALLWYAHAVEAAKTRREKADALRRVGDALTESHRADSAVVVFEQALKSEERPKYRLDIALRRAEALRDLGRFDQALAYLEQWRPNAITEKREGELLLRLHDVQARLGRTQDAINGYRRLIDRFPSTAVAYDAQFRIGYLYEASMGDYDAAAKEYEKLRSGPPSEFQAQANRRSQGLASLKQFRDKLSADTTQAKAKAAFMVAELYYFQLEQPDSAIRQYRIVEAEFPQSVYAPKSAYARLWIMALDRSDTLGAQALTDTMAVRYRGTRYAESALYFWKRWTRRHDERTTLLDSLLANPDTTGASRYAAEEADTTELIAPTAAGADSTYELPPAVKDLLNARRNALQGKGAPPVPPVPPPGSTPADTTRAPGARPDTSRAAPDSTKSPIPPAPPDSGTIFIHPQR